MRAILPFLLLLTSCATLPQLYQSAEDIANDDAISVMISREAMSTKKDVNVSVDVKNIQAQ